jgi:glycine cleavage system H protein
MSAPEHLKYTSSHEWLRRETDGSVSIGITQHAQEQLGDVVFVDNPQPGRRVQQGEECGVIESVKAAGDIHAPVSGEIIAANAELADAPEKINEDPYAAWMFRIKPSDPAQIDALLDAAGYLKTVETGDA